MKKTSSLIFRISQFNGENRRERHVGENGTMLQRPWMGVINCPGALSFEQRLAKEARIIQK